MGDNPIGPPILNEDLEDYRSSQDSPNTVLLRPWANIPDGDNKVPSQLRNLPDPYQGISNPGLQQENKTPALVHDAPCKPEPSSLVDQMSGNVEGRCSEAEKEVEKRKEAKEPPKRDRAEASCKPAIKPRRGLESKSSTVYLLAEVAVSKTELKKDKEAVEHCEPVEPQVYDGRYSRKLNCDTKVQPIPNHAIGSIQEASSIDEVIQQVTGQLENNAKINTAVEAIQGSPSLGTSMVTQMLTSIVIKALEDIIRVLDSSKKAPRAYQSYAEVVRKLTIAIEFLKPENPLTEGSLETNIHKGDHHCDLALKAAQQLNPAATSSSIRQYTTKVRSCRLQALAGLSLLYSQSKGRIAWDVLLTLVQSAKFTNPSEYSTSFLEAIQDAIEGTYDPLLAPQIDEEGKLVKPAKEPLARMQSANAPKVKKAKLLSDRTFQVGFKRTICSTCQIEKPHPYWTDNRALKRWLHLYSQVAELTNEQLCRFNLDASSPKEISIPTYSQAVNMKTSEYLKILVPGIVDNLLRIRLAEKRNESIKMKPIRLCSHTGEITSKPWIGTNGVIEPTFAAIIFIDSPSLNDDKPVMIVNEEKVFRWIDYLTMRPIEGLAEPIRLYDFFSSPEAMRSIAKVISEDNVHKLRLQSTGSTPLSCANKLHEEKVWLDDRLPINISTCKLNWPTEAKNFSKNN